MLVYMTSEYSTQCHAKYFHVLVSEFDLKPFVLLLSNICLISFNSVLLLVKCCHLLMRHLQQSNSYRSYTSITLLL